MPRKTMRTQGKLEAMDLEQSLTPIQDYQGLLHSPNGSCQATKGLWDDSIAGRR